MKHVRFKDWDCIVQKCQYGNGRPALQLIDANDGDPIATATVNLPDVPAGPNEVFIKDYSENEGMLKALTDAGVIKPTGDSVRSGFVTVPRAELQPPFRELTHEERLNQRAAEAQARSQSPEKGRSR
jgi:hypothetical protein